MFQLSQAPRCFTWLYLLFAVSSDFFHSVRVFTCDFYMWPRWMDQNRGVLWIANLLSPVGADHEFIVS